MGRPRRPARAQRRSSLDAITPKAPITIGLPMALTNQGWERTCSSITSDAAAGHNWRCVYSSGPICEGLSEGSPSWFCKPPKSTPALQRPQ